MDVADRVVIGGGIVGWSTALELLERDPRRRVVVVDDARTGRATDAGAGIATPFTRRDMGEDWAATMFAAMRTYAALLPRLRDAGLEPGHEVVGKLLVAADDVEAAQLPEVLRRAQAQVAELGAVGIGAPELIDEAAVRSLHPLLGTVEAALLLPEVAQVDGRALTAALRRRARILGATERVGSAELLVSGDQLRGVRVDADVIASDAVVLAAGAWTERLLSPHGLSGGIYPQRGQIAHARIDRATPLPIAGGFDPTYLLCFGGGRLVFGPTREDDSGFEEAPTVGALHAMLERARRLAPGIAAARWLEIRSGLRPMSRDGVPTIGAFEHLPGLVLATGLGAQGLTVGPHVGGWAAQLADGEAPPVPVAFSPQRWVG
ncbi:NAD(P)/FAD-dependent oxidoreductase [Pseudactinotalea suaedae]|uniref:NAD(P)/FAD-dependent oxidoreductase n=1 Tax=Pseudactinotalea suaedae TaxID=1524924 RepID=UPI001390ABF9|nr:FAD-dependent oxidoreductase [Pseudactinotalea suaedae]